MGWGTLSLHHITCFVILQLAGDGSCVYVLLFLPHANTCSSPSVTALSLKVQSKEDGKLYAVKRSAEKFKGALDRFVWQGGNMHLCCVMM